MARKFSKTDLHSATIEGLSHEGEGIARIEGKTTFIVGALIGEEVLFNYTLKKKNYDRGICQQVIKESPLRVEPPCSYADICGGCSMQHIANEAQIEIKQNVLKEHFEHIGDVQPEEWLPPMTGEVINYRRKARLSVRFVRKKEKVLVGFREKQSGRFIADIERCIILHPKVGELISPLKQFIFTLEGFREIAQIEVAVGERRTILILRHLQPLSETDKEKLNQFQSEYGIEWYLQSGGPDTVMPLNGDGAPQLLEYRIDGLGLRYQFEPTDFTQVNPSINQQMVADAIDMLDIQPDDDVLDLFSGLGNFSLALAQKAKHVVGVEGCTKMTKRAYSNAKLNDISNVAFFTADLFTSIVNEPWSNKTYHKILLDPPRAGAQEICQAIKQFQASAILYISCATASLARDAKILCDNGYYLAKAGVMDMFPHTAHVESIALFLKKD